MTDEFRQPEQRTTNGALPLPALTIALGSTKPGEKSYTGRVSYGTFEAWICLECGYTEFYAHGLEGIAGIARQHPEQLRIVDANPPGLGPYR